MNKFVVFKTKPKKKTSKWLFFKNIYWANCFLVFFCFFNGPTSLLSVVVVVVPELTVAGLLHLCWTIAGRGSAECSLLLLSVEERACWWWRWCESQGGFCGLLSAGLCCLWWRWWWGCYWSRFALRLLMHRWSVLQTEMWTWCGPREYYPACCCSVEFALGSWDQPRYVILQLAAASAASCHSLLCVLWYQENKKKRFVTNWWKKIEELAVAFELFMY